ncbi:MAG: FGGY family carbohydrate kinase [Verrucomicrobiota bacterium]|nr:FGGY family carbohydrate kinase [Verrucomicrobiota bacterium]
MARSSASVVLALDIGSSSVRSALFRETGARILRSGASRKYAMRYSSDGGAELDPQVVLRATRTCVAETRSTARNAHAIAISGSAFWHGLLGVDAKGVPLTPIYMWADTRSAGEAANMRRQLSERKIQLRTGCLLRAPFWPAKLAWLERRDVARWLSPAAWIFEQLFGVAGTSDSMASGTGLYNWRTRSWDEELCRLVAVPIDKLGAIENAEQTTFTAIGDGAASNLGSGADNKRKLAINIGTSAAVRAIIPRRLLSPARLPHGFFRYVVDQERDVIGGAVSNAGNLRSWCMRELRIRDDAEAERALSRSAAAEDALTVLPFWVEERAPTWPENLHGAIAGVRQVTSAADVLRVTTTAVYYRLAAIADELEAALGRSTEIIVSGGILHSPASLDILADALGRDIRVCSEMESSLRGAARYALEHLGYRVAPLRNGKLIRHRPSLAAKHRDRRARQEEVERRLSR